MGATFGLTSNKRGAWKVSLLAVERDDLVDLLKYNCVSYISRYTNVSYLP